MSVNMRGEYESVSVSTRVNVKASFPVEARVSESESKS